MNKFKKTNSLLLLLLALSISACQVDVFGMDIGLARPEFSGESDLPATPVPLQTKQSSPSPAALSTGSTVQMREVCANVALYIRSSAGAPAPVIGSLVNGEHVTLVVEGSGKISTQSASDGGTWVQILISASQTGWVNSRYLCDPKEDE